MARQVARGGVGDKTSYIVRWSTNLHSNGIGTYKPLQPMRGVLRRTPRGAAIAGRWASLQRRIPKGLCCIRLGVVAKGSSRVRNFL